MKKKEPVIQYIAPVLASALKGPLAGIANKFITDHLIKENHANNQLPENMIETLLNDSRNLQEIKDIDNKFKIEMEALNIDVFSLEAESKKKTKDQSKMDNKPQVIISILFLVAYFIMLASIFYVEASDTFNMKQGENSLAGELQILFGVLTAGVGQILSFWFGGALKKNDDA